MRLLLDTHVLIWSQLDPARLSSRAAAALEECSARFYSPLSVWEIELLVRKRRVELNVELAAWIASAAAEHALQEAALSTAIVLEAGRMKFDHADPVDRFLAATAKIHGLTMVSADARLRQRHDVAVLWD